jgi:hypothetical protein
MAQICQATIPISDIVRYECFDQINTLLPGRILTNCISTKRCKPPRPSVSFVRPHSTKEFNCKLIATCLHYSRMGQRIPWNLTWLVNRGSFVSRCHLRHTTVSKPLSHLLQTASPPNLCWSGRVTPSMAIDKQFCVASSSCRSERPLASVNSASRPRAGLRGRTQLLDTDSRRLDHLDAGRFRSNACSYAGGQKVTNTERPPLA